jgi:hypothetical protein
MRRSKNGVQKSIAESLQPLMFRIGDRYLTQNRMVTTRIQFRALNLTGDSWDRSDVLRAPVAVAAIRKITPKKRESMVAHASCMEDAGHLLSPYPIFWYVDFRIEKSLPRPFY